MARRKKINHKKEINAVIYFAVAILFAVAYYWPDADAGWLGRVLVMLGRGLVGVIAYVLPMLMIYIGVEQLAGKGRNRPNLRAVFVALLLLTIGSIMHLATIDQVKLQSQFIDAENQLSAIKAVAALWQTGVDPTILGDGFILSGGLIPGLLAQAMLALAGPVGGMILTVAMTLAFCVLIFNISYTQTIHKTAQVLKKAPAQLGSAVQAQLSAREKAIQSRVETHLEPSSYDLELPHSTTEETRRSLLNGWHEFWTRRTSLRADQVIPDDVFSPIQSPDQAGVTQTGQQNHGFAVMNDEETEVAAYLSASKLPYTLTKDQNGFLTIQPTGASNSVTVSSSPAPGPTAPDVPHQASHLNQNRTQTNADPHAGESINSDHFGRSHWEDRSDQVAPTVSVLGLNQSARKTVPGEQLAIEVPYTPPPLNLLREDNLQQSVKNSQASIQALGHKLEQTLESFGVAAKVVHFTTGPTITRFELAPGPGVKVSRIVNLADDIALNLAAMGVRIEAPIPGKAAIGIEIPNKETMPVLLRSLLDSAEFKQSNSPLTAAIGRDIQGNPLLCDLAKMPHLLIAGATGSGKSVCINSILMSILFKASPDQVRMLMIDPKVVELNIYNGIPHLIHPVVTDPKKAAGTLQWAVNEMVRRYSLFADKSVRDIASYNASVGLGLDPEDDEEQLPLILVVIDELSDLMATTPTEVEDAIARLTAMARAAGIHLIIATQRPSVDVITGVIKANIPSRVAFAVASQIDSRTILDMAGAEKLLGKGDMLYYPQSAAKPVRGQGAFITDAEVERVIAHVKSLHKSSYDQKVADAIIATTAATGRKDKDKDDGDQDELLPQALQICVETGYASVSLLQRRMTVGYPRAARLIDRMHELGYIGGFEGSKPRKVLISLNQLMEMQMKAQIDAAEDDE